MLRGEFLLHQQHLTGALNGAIQFPLIMGRKTRVLARQDAALLGHKLLEQIDVLVVKGIDCEIDFWLWTWGADFHGRTSAAVC